MFKDNGVLRKISDIGIVPVVKLNSPESAVPLGKALIAGNIPVAEVTFRTDAAEEAIIRLSSELPELIVGAGTVTNVEQAKKAVKAGAKFLVSPGFNPNVVGYCVDNGITITPGVNNPSQVEQGMEFGLSTLKFFPAEQSGGIEMLKALSGPYGKMKYIPTGGIDSKNMAAYLALGNVAAVGGSWMVRPELIDAGRYDEITQICNDAVTASMGFELRHIGINEPDEASMADDAKKMSELFRFSLKPGNSSCFTGTGFEFMKTQYLGKNGHIAIATLNVDRAVAYFDKMGIKSLPETEKRDKSGALTVAYLDIEIGGFALHLVKK